MLSSEVTVKERYRHCLQGDHNPSEKSGVSATNQVGVGWQERAMKQHFILPGVSSRK